MKNVDDTIAKLDKTLSSLLTDSSVNGYSINKTSNIIVGVISLLSNYIGANASNATIDLLNTYLYYLMARMHVLLIQMVTLILRISTQTKVLQQ